MLKLFILMLLLSGGLVFYKHSKKIHFSEIPPWEDTPTQSSTSGTPTSTDATFDSKPATKCSETPIVSDARTVCFYRGEPTPCVSAVSGYKAAFLCDKYFIAAANVKMPSAECLENGLWSEHDFSCIAECGKMNVPNVPLIAGGQVASKLVIPWQAAIYHLIDAEWELVCGGSLISKSLVLTAAHCIYHVDASDMNVALGKFYKDYTLTERNAQYFNVVSAESISSYQDFEGNYNTDLGVINLETPAVLNEYIRPICIDLNRLYYTDHLQHGNYGTVCGWGASDGFQQVTELRVINIPVVSREVCLENLPDYYKKYLTYTGFCAGFGNGSGVCNGDSGGGLAFYEPSVSTWYVQGVVSNSPKEEHTGFCDLRYYTIFTTVAELNSWILAKIPISE